MVDLKELEKRLDTALDKDVFDMYMKCTKKQLAEMLIECHRLLDINVNRVSKNEECYYSTTTTGRYENTENDIKTDS